MAEIYDDIPLWDGAVQYEIDDVVLKDGYYFFCKKPHKNISPLEHPIYWANGQDFWWAISYGTDIQYEAKVNEISLGDNYKQSVPKGLGNVRYKPFTLKFNLISNKQAKAITLFLSNVNKYKYYNYYLPMPHDRTIKVVCKNWQIIKNYDNSHTLNSVFEEYYNYDYQPSFVETIATNITTTDIVVRFIAQKYKDNTINYNVAKCKVYTDLQSNEYVAAAYDILLPYVSNGSFKVQNNYLTIVLKGIRRDGAYSQSYADNLKTTLLSLNLINITDSIEAFVLDGKIYYIAVQSTKIANIDSSDIYEKSVISTSTTLQFLPFKCNYNANESKIWSTNWDTDKAILSNYSLQNKWATMTLKDALSFWWNAYYFICVTGYGTLSTQITNHSQLGQFTPKTFTMSSALPGGTTYGYCWVTNGDCRYQSSDVLLHYLTNYTAIIPRNILDIKVVLYSQIYIPVSTMAVGSWPLVGFYTDQGTYLSGLNGFGTGPIEGNPNRGIQSDTASTIYTGKSCKAPNYTEYLYGFHTVSYQGYFFNTQSNWCIVVTPLNRASRTVSLNSSLDSIIKANNQAAGAALRANGISITTENGKVNTCSENASANASIAGVNEDICTTDMSVDSDDESSNTNEEFVKFLFRLLGVS